MEKDIWKKPCTLEMLKFEDKAILLRFSYPGMLPHYNETELNRAEVQKRKREMRDHYWETTYQTLQQQAIKSNFSKSFIYIVHFFSDLSPRDFDNRGRKFVIDALRYTKIIPDDSWKYISIMESGHLDRGNPHVDVFVCNDEKKVDLIQYIEKYHVRAMS